MFSALVVFGFVLRQKKQKLIQLVWLEEKFDLSGEIKGLSVRFLYKKDAAFTEDALNVSFLSF